MKKFAAAIARNKGIKAPAGYTKSAAVCRAFLDGYAPKRGSGADVGSGGGGASTVASGEGAPNARQTRRRTKGAAAKRKSFRPGRAEFEAGTPLRIPYGNKEVALKLGARYDAGGLVRAAGRRPVRLSGAGLVAVIRNAAGVPLAVATIPSGMGGARARAREAWSGGPLLFENLHSVTEPVRCANQHG